MGPRTGSSKEQEAESDADGQEESARQRRGRAFTSSAAEQVGYQVHRHEGEREREDRHTERQKIGSVLFVVASDQDLHEEDGNEEQGKRIWRMMRGESSSVTPLTLRAMKKNIAQKRRTNV